MRRPPTSTTSGASCSPCDAPQHGLHAGDELARVEGLRHVVVGADLQTDDPVDVVAARGEDDHGDVARLAELFADGEAVHLRHHHVEDDEVRLEGLRLFERLLAVVRSLDPEALVVEVQPGELDDVLLVVDD